MNTATLRAYERWAPIYPPVPHNPVMRVEQDTMLSMCPDVAGRSVLDLACGSGRYTQLLEELGAESVVAVDFCMPMLAQVSSLARVCASMMDLPFVERCFDTVVSGLAVGHASDIHGWMSEVSRVLRPGGTLLYSDFHPDAAKAGLTRSFKDKNNYSCTVPHALYPVQEQIAAAAAAGFAVEDVREARVGYELTESFRGAESFYRDWHGLPIVLVVQARLR